MHGGAPRTRRKVNGEKTTVKVNKGEVLDRVVGGIITAGTAALVASMVNKNGNS